jgi:hypothetical protein
MIGIEIIVDALQPIVDALNTVPEAAMAGVQDAVATIRRLALGRTPVGATGNLKRSWSGVEYTSGGLSYGDAYQFGNPLWYSEIIELGKFKSVGPRTVKMGDGIYSKQAPGGILKPLVDDDHVLANAAAMVLAEIARRLNARATT